MTFRPASDPDRFPVDAITDQVVTALGNDDVAIVVAPPGAGKTTRLPLAVLDAPWCTGAVILTQPRRLAARTAALRLAETLGGALGGVVGLRTGEETKVSAQTKLVVVTEGVLLRMIEHDPSLDGVSAVLLDEVHERSVDADLAIALLRDVRSVFRPDLRLGLLSATVDETAFIRALNAPVVRSEGRSFPIERSWEPALVAELAGATASVVARELGRCGPGETVLVFAPGRYEIEGVRRSLGRGSLPSDVEVLTLHGSSSRAEVNAALAPVPARTRRVVIATNIAQTSLTLPGVTVVVDQGLIRRNVVDPVTGLGRMATERVSQATATQRAGRAGRLSPGRAIALWSAAEHQTLDTHDRPELLRADLTDAVLTALAWGARTPDDLSWIDAPPVASWEAAVQTLHDLDAVDENRSLTGIGRMLAELPVSAQLGRIAVEAAGLDEPLRSDAIALVAILSADRRTASPDASLTDEVRALADVVRTTTSGRSRPTGDETQRRALRVAEALRTAAATVVSPETDRRERAESLGGLASLALPRRIAARRPDRSDRFVLVDGTEATLPPDHPLLGTSLIVAVELDADRRNGKIFSALPVNADEIVALHRHRLSATTVVSLDGGPLDGTVAVREDVRLGAAVVQTRRRPPTPQEVSGAVLDAVDATVLRSWAGDALPEVAARVTFVRARSNGIDWPDLSIDGLLASTGDWLEPLLAGAPANRPLRSVSVDAALSMLLPYDLRRELDRRAPERVTLPTGRSVAVDYTAEAGPTVRGKVQEFFGTAASPQVDGVACVVECLTPAGRVAAVTDDLARFWTVGYPSMRADLRGRYPKHDWPENPADAKPQTGTKAAEARKAARGD